MGAQGPWGCPVGPRGIFQGEFVLRTPGEEEEQQEEQQEEKDPAGKGARLEIWGELGIEAVGSALVSKPSPGVGWVLIVWKPFGHSRRGTQSLPQTFPLPLRAVTPPHPPQSPPRSARILRGYFRIISPSRGRDPSPTACVTPGGVWGIPQAS